MKFALSSILFWQAAMANDSDLIRYEHVAQIFENRCSGCHNKHLQQRNGLPSWSDASLATSRRDAIAVFVIETELMPKKWSPKFRDWPLSEQKLFQGWLQGKTFHDAGVSMNEQVPPLISWTQPTARQVDDVFAKRHCFYCEETKSQMTAENSQELGNQIYWRVFYLGLPPHADAERQQLLQWSLDDLILVASWLKNSCQVEVSPQWLHVRASIGRP